MKVQNTFLAQSLANLERASQPHLADQPSLLWSYA